MLLLQATCFAYGQTGSGKTYTMQPLPLRAAADIFSYLALPENRQAPLIRSCLTRTAACLLSAPVHRPNAAGNAGPCACPAKTCM